MRTKLYLASTEALADEARFLRLSRTLPDARREKLASLRHLGARRLSLGAGLLLNYALRSEGLPPTEYAVTEHGKPFFPALPDFCFNLSHSGSRVLCAVSPSPIGCDVELLGTVDFAIARRFFHPDECAWLLSLPESEREAAFFRLWTCKESFVKALGLGLSLPLDSFAVSFADGIALRQTVDPRPWALRSFREDGYLYALCGLDGVSDAELIRVSLEEVEP